MNWPGGEGGATSGPDYTAVRGFKATRGFMCAPPLPHPRPRIRRWWGIPTAERTLIAYQSDPNSWSKRRPNNNSMAVVGAGWYHEELAFGV